MSVLFILKMVVALLLFLSGLAWGWWWAVSSQRGMKTSWSRIAIGGLGALPVLLGIWLMYHIV